MPAQYRTAATMAFTAAMLLVLPAACCARLLHGVASASSLSTGGTATSVSQSLGDSEVITAAISTNGGAAAAIQSADSGKHTQVTVADGTYNDTWTTSTHDGKPSSWSDVPACKASPSRTNSVKDGSGQLWGYEDNTSCAYKDPKDHHPLFYWEAAPACPGSPGADSVTDSQDRVWGWADGVSCAYKDSHLRKLMGHRQLAQSAGPDGNNNLPESTQDDPTTAQPDATNATAAAQYRSQAWARSWSTATSWHWSSTGGNTTQEVHAEAETDAYSNNGTATANATTHATINGSTADAAADGDTTGDQTTAAAKVTSTQATQPTARRLLQPVHTVMPLGQNGVPLNTTPEVLQNVPPLSNAADIPPQANVTSSPAHDAAPNSNSNAPSPAPIGANMANTSPSPSLDIGAKELSSNESTTVAAADTPAPHRSPEPSSPAPKKVNPTSPGLQHSQTDNSTNTLAVGAGAAGASNATNVTNSTADTMSVSIQNSTAGSGDMAVQCQTVTNIYGQKSLKCEKVAVYSAVKPPAANMVGNTNFQAAEWDDSKDHNNTVARSTSPQALPVNTTTTATAPGGVSTNVPASSAGSVSGNLTAAPVPSPSPAAGQTSSTENMPDPAAVSADNNSMTAATPSSGDLTVPQLSSQDSQASPGTGSIVISPVIQPVISPVVSPQIIITINPSAGSNATAAAVPTATSANVTATKATQSTTNGPVTIEYSPAKSNTSSAVDTTDDVSNSAAAAPMDPTSKRPEDAAATPTNEAITSTVQASPGPAVADVAASPEVPAPTAAANPSTPVASVAVSPSAPTWDTAPACSAFPTKDTSVQDTWGRLWWSESGVSCAYRDAATGQPIYYTGYQSVTWESAPVCDYAATSTNTMPDTEGRAWGWQQSNSRSCKFETASGAALMHQSLVAKTS